MKKLKKMLSVVLIAVILQGLLSVSLMSTYAANTEQAKSYYTENGYTYTVSNGEATIVKGVKITRGMIIPDTLGGYPVVAIGDNAFDSMDMAGWGDTSIKLPDTVKYIGKRAFYAISKSDYYDEYNIIFYNVLSVIIPGNVSYVGDEAFGYSYQGIYHGRYDDDPEIGELSKFKIYGKAGSATQEYADKHKFDFIDIDTVTTSLSETDKDMQCGTEGTLKVSFSVEDKVLTTSKWYSSNTNVVTVNEYGELTAKNKGTAIITAYPVTGGSLTCKVNVTGPQYIKLDKSSIRLYEGSTSKLTVSKYPSYAETSYTWSSSDESIAVVNDSGDVTGVNAGTVVITVTAENGVTASCEVTVQVSPEEVAITPSYLNLIFGKTYKLDTVLTPVNAVTSLTWKSSNTTVATVSYTGLVQALNVGTTVITVTTSNGKTASCVVNVIWDEPTDINLSKTKLNLDIGNSYKLTASLVPSNAMTTYTWNSSDTSVATVTENGLVKAVGKGTAIITVTTNGGLKATCRITVGSDTVIGDINGDSKVTLADAVLIQKYLIGTLELTTEQLSAADISGDGDVTLVDAVKFQKMLIN